MVAFRGGVAAVMSLPTSTVDVRASISKIIRSDQAMQAAMSAGSKMSSLASIAILRVHRPREQQSHPAGTVNNRWRGIEAGSFNSSMIAKAAHAACCSRSREIFWRARLMRLLTVPIGKLKA
jgi:hypothetical protein